MGHEPRRAHRTGPRRVSELEVRRPGDLSEVHSAIRAVLEAVVDAGRSGADRSPERLERLGTAAVLAQAELDVLQRYSVAKGHVLVADLVPLLKSIQFGVDHPSAEARLLCLDRLEELERLYTAAVDTTNRAEARVLPLLESPEAERHVLGRTGRTIRRQLAESLDG